MSPSHLDASHVQGASSDLGAIALGPSWSLSNVRAAALASFSSWVRRGRPRGRFSSALSLGAGGTLDFLVAALTTALASFSSWVRRGRPRGRFSATGFVTDFLTDSPFLGLEPSKIAARWCLAKANLVS